ncbi:MAG: lipoate--protein ligase [Pyramidobacter sp.]|nr:lipoate--protein ligase [Pyramidobacter sp.]
MGKVTYLETHSQDPRYNLAFEEYVLTQRTDGDYLILWQNKNTIVVGRNQNAEEEINRSFVDEHNITVVRRTTGGGAVYHDLGNLNYSFITDACEATLVSNERFTKPVVEALSKLGLNAVVSGRNDILVDGKKVSGTAQRLYKDRILHHGTLLFDSDMSMIAGSLNASPEKFNSKSVKSVASRVGSIRGSLKKDMSLDEFWDFLKRNLGGDFEQGQLTNRELEAVNGLKEKYVSWEWTYGLAPAYDMQCRRRFDGGTVDAHLSVKDGYISNIKFYGDYLALTSNEELIAALIGCRFCRENVEAVLDRFSIIEMFGTVSKNEILSLLFESGK